MVTLNCSFRELNVWEERKEIVRGRNIAKHREIDTNVKNYGNYKNKHIGTYGKRKRSIVMKELQR
jgi:hypothetical protein